MENPQFPGNRPKSACDDTAVAYSRGHYHCGVTDLSDFMRMELIPNSELPDAPKLMGRPERRV